MLVVDPTFQPDVQPSSTAYLQKVAVIGPHIAKAIHADAIPRGTVARLAGRWPTDLGAYLNGRRFAHLEREERVAWIVSEIVGMTEATKHLRLDWCDPPYVQGLIDLAQEPEDLPDLRAGAEVD